MWSSSHASLVSYFVYNGIILLFDRKLSNILTRCEAMYELDWCVACVVWNIPSLLDMRVSYCCIHPHLCCWIRKALVPILWRDHVLVITFRKVIGHENGPLIWHRWDGTKKSRSRFQVSTKFWIPFITKHITKPEQVARPIQVWHSSHMSMNRFKKHFQTYINLGYNSFVSWNRLEYSFPKY